MTDKYNLDQFTSEYLPGSTTSFENELILNWYPKRILSRVNGSHSILELGLGHGHSACVFNPFFKRHVVIEGSSVVIDLFHQRKSNENVEIIKTFFEDFNTSERFDVIVMGFILEHVDNPESILLQYSKFLAPGGKMYVAVPNAKSLNRRLGLEMGMINDIYELNDNDIAQGHKRQFCRSTLKELLHSCGYNVTMEEGIYLKPLPLKFLKMLPNLNENLEAMLKVGIDFPDLCVGLLMEINSK